VHPGQEGHLWSQREIPNGGQTWNPTLQKTKGGAPGAPRKCYDGGKEVPTKMAEKHPYSPGGAGGIIAAITHFRNALPAQITADTLKKLGIAPNNESYIINILRFVGVIDADGTKTEKAASAFSKDDTEFQKEFGDMVRAAYNELFSLHKDSAWSLPDNKLISFFRTADQTSNLTGRRQAGTFQALASLAGHGVTPVQPKSYNK
jgi:hypothetical protein